MALAGAGAGGGVDAYHREPGVGKSMLALEIVARLTTARAWPDGQASAGRPHDVIYVGGEDDLVSTVRPRLEAAGGDASRVYSLEQVRDENHCDPELFRLRTHHQTLMKLIQSMSDPAGDHPPGGASAGRRIPQTRTGRDVGLGAARRAAGPDRGFVRPTPRKSWKVEKLKS